MHPRRNRLARRLAAAAWLTAGTWIAGPAGAQTPPPFPTRPVRVVLPLPAGGERDLVANVLAQQLTRSWRQDVKIDFRPDGPSAEGTAQVARAYADGYTLLLATPALAIRVALRRPTPFDAARDLLPITSLVHTPLALVMPTASPVAAIGEWIERARARPGELALGHLPGADVSRLGSALFAQSAAVRLRNVRVASAATLAGEIAAGRVDVALLPLPAVHPHLQAGHLRALAVGSPRRAALLPDVPTLAESALPGFEVLDWTGVLAPARTPDGIVARLQSDLAAVVHLPENRDRLLAAGFEPDGSSQADFAGRLGAEIRRWSRLLQDTGLRPD